MRERELAGFCAACGEPIYAGEAVWRDECHLLHDNTGCLIEWVRRNRPVRELLEAAGVAWGIAYGA